MTNESELLYLPFSNLTPEILNFITYLVGSCSPILADRLLSDIDHVRFIWNICFLCRFQWHACKLANA